MTDNRTTELLPCPFCGGEASKRLFYVARYGVYCDECDARVGGLFNTEAEAIAAWNTRADTEYGGIPATDENMAKYGWVRERTCELVETDSYSNANEVIHVLECSECGETCEHVNGSYPRCPHCGWKAVKR